MNFKEIDKVQIKATCMPNIVTGAFEDDIKLSIKHSQWCGYPKVFDIEKIESIEKREVKGEVVSHKLIANALITQKAPNDTSHDDDLDQFKNPK